AASTSLAVRSGIFVRAISSTCARVTVPTFVLPGSFEPLSRPAARFSSTDAGGVFVTKVNERSAYTVMTTGMMSPSCAWVCALKALQNSMMFTPRCPSAGPTGGLGFACPAGICSLISATTFLAMSLGFLDLHEVELDGRRATEDADQHAQLALVGLHFLNDTVEVLERPVDHLHVLALLEEHLGLRLDGALLHLMRDLAHLGFRDRRDGVGIGGAAEESGDLRRGLDDVPGLVVEAHVHEDVAGEELPRRRLLLPLHQLD